MLLKDGDGVVLFRSERWGRVRIFNQISATIRAEKVDVGVVQKEQEDLTVSEEKRIRIRKLTPLECWRLMAFDDEDFKKAEKVNSNSQLYKQAGNSIVVDVLYHIFKEMM